MRSSLLETARGGFNNIKGYLPSALLILSFLLLWEIVVRQVQIPAYILPTPSHIFQRMFMDYKILFQHTLVTLAEVIAGFAIAFAAGIALALLIFHSKTLGKAFYPLIILSQNIPVFAIAPLLVFWLGYGIAPKIIVAALIIFFPIVVNTVDGLRAVDEDLINLFKILQASSWQILVKVRLPGALPFIFSGTKIGVTLSVVGAVIGEWIGAQAGLGYLMLHANRLLKIDLVFAAIFWLSALGISLFALISLLEWLALPWRRVSHE